MQTTVKLTQEDIKTIILDFYKRQGDTKESVHFYEQVKENEDESEIYAIVSEKEFPLSLNSNTENEDKEDCEQKKSEQVMSLRKMKQISVAGRPSTYERMAELSRIRRGER